MAVSHNVRTMNQALSPSSLLNMMTSAAALLVTCPGHAQTQPVPLSTQACIAAHEAAMALRGANKLRAARDEAATCTNSACPQIIRSSCAELGETLVDSQPSIVVRITDGAGNDIEGVHLTIDSAPMERLEGKPVDVDPGSHRARFERQGYLTQEMVFVIQEGEKRRSVNVTLQPAPPIAPPPISPNPPGVDAPASQASAAPTVEGSEFGFWRTVGVASAGAGALGMGAGAVLFVLAKSDRDESLRLGCDTHAVCTTTDGLNAADNARIEADWGTGLVYGGGALMLTGAAVYLIDALGDTPQRSDMARSSRAVHIAPQLGVGGGGVAVVGPF